jgi:hypothetical protein
MILVWLQFVVHHPIGVKSVSSCQYQTGTTDEVKKKIVNRASSEGKTRQNDEKRTSVTK